MYKLSVDFSASPFIVTSNALADCADEYLKNKPYFYDFGTMYYYSEQPYFGMLYIDGRIIMHEDGVLGDISRLDITDKSAALEAVFRLLGFDRLVLSEGCSVDIPTGCKVTRIPSSERPVYRGMMRILRDRYVRRLMNNL